MEYWQGRGLGTVIAERQFFLDGKGTVWGRIGEPLASDAEPYEGGCPWQIEGMGSGKVRFAFGFDRMQALWLAIQALGTELYSSEEYRAGRLAAFEEGERQFYLALPVLNGFEDLLPDKGT